MMNISTLVIALFLLFSCQQGERSLLIDNPTNKPVTILFKNEEPLLIEPNTKKEIVTKYGKRILSIDAGPPQKIHLKPSEEYLLNPTLSYYYIHRVPYFENSRGKERYRNQYGETTSRIQHPNFDELFFEIEGDVQTIKGQLLITKSWNFGLDETPTPELGTRSAVDKGCVLVKKLYRISDLFPFKN